MRRNIPNLKVLDDIPLSGLIRMGTPSNFSSDWSFLRELENDGTIGSLESIEEVEMSGQFMHFNTLYST